MRTRRGDGSALVAREAVMGRRPRAPSPLTGRRFGSRVVTRSTDDPERVIARCDCGRLDTVRAVALLKGTAGRCARCRQIGKGGRKPIRLPCGLTFQELSQLTGIHFRTLYSRWRIGWPEALLALPESRRRGSGVPSATPTPAMISRLSGVPVDVIAQRRRLGWPRALWAMEAPDPRLYAMKARPGGWAPTDPAGARAALEEWAVAPPARSR